MKKAVIVTGGKQYVVSEGETITVELLDQTTPKLDFEPLLVIDGDNVTVGTPTLTTPKVQAEIIEADVQAEKVTSIRYKSKKRVHKVRGHRQHQTVLKISRIA